MASLVPPLGKPPEKSMVAASGTTTTLSPISRRKRSAAVVFPPPGPPVRTMQQRRGAGLRGDFVPMAGTMGFAGGNCKPALPGGGSGAC